MAIVKLNEDATNNTQQQNNPNDQKVKALKAQLQTAQSQQADQVQNQLSTARTPQDKAKVMDQITKQAANDSGNAGNTTATGTTTANNLKPKNTNTPMKNSGAKKRKKKKIKENFDVDKYRESIVKAYSLISEDVPQQQSSSPLQNNVMNKNEKDPTNNEFVNNHSNTSEEDQQNKDDQKSDDVLDEISKLDRRINKISKALEKSKKLVSNIKNGYKQRQFPPSNTNII